MRNPKHHGNIKAHLSWSTKLTAPIVCFVIGVEGQKNVNRGTATEFKQEKMTTI